MNSLRHPHRLTNFLVFLLVVFLVLFPKGGFGIGGLPLTWGYILLAVSVPPLLLLRILYMPLRIPGRVLAVFLALLPMQVLYLYAGAFYGISEMAFAVATFVSLFLLPAVFLFIFPPFLKWVNGDNLSRCLRWCILIAAVWGIFNFFWHAYTRTFIEIPFLTVNAADYGKLDLNKHNSRGMFYKLISTYNNGNIYGVATLLLLPTYDLLEKMRWRRWIVKAAVLMTLSRSVWAGLVLAEMFPLALQLAKQAKTFPRVFLGSLLKRAVAVAVTLILVCSALLFNTSTGLAFLLDPTFGGRNAMFQEIFDATLLPSKPLAGFQEVLYTSAANYYGYAGALAMVLLLFSPLLVLLVDPSAVNSPSRRAALKGLVLYIFLAAADGGFNYIPVMAFYWFVYMIFLFGWPSALATRSPMQVRSELSPGPKPVPA